MRKLIFMASLMIGMTSVAQKGMDDYASVDFKPKGNVKVFVETFKTYIYNVDFLEDAMIFDTEIDNVMTEYYRILSENSVKFKQEKMEDLFSIVDKDGFIYIRHEKNGIEYIVTIQDTSGEIIVITQQ